MTILLHSCCGPCLVGSYPILELEVGSNNITLYWDNPNIHPFLEYKERLDSFKLAAQALKIEYLHGDINYGLIKFLDTLNTQKNATTNITSYGSERCEMCYRMRLESTAKKTAEQGFEAFSTTLLISPYQNHELLIKIGKDMAKRYNTKFHSTDFRPAFRDSHEKAKKLGLYRQKYCGCIFSEYDRYKKYESVKS